MTVVLIVALVVVLVVLLGLMSGVRMVQQYQRGVVLRFGRLLPEVRGPGLHLIIPLVDRMSKVSIQTIVLDIPSQGTITRDNVTIGVDAVVYFRVVDPVRALINVQNHLLATSQVSRTSLRSVIGRADLDTLLSDREQINGELKAVIDAPTEDWGISVERVEIKDISLPEQMRRSMSRQAEAERDRRARVIAADGEYQASTKLAQAANAMSATPGALQLRLLQTVADVASEKNSTLVMPFPVELLRFFERASGSGVDGSGTAALGANGTVANGTVTKGTGANGTGANGTGANGTGANGTGTNGDSAAAGSTAAVVAPPATDTAAEEVPELEVADLPPVTLPGPALGGTVTTGRRADRG